MTNQTSSSSNEVTNHAAKSCSLKRPRTIDHIDEDGSPTKKHHGDDYTCRLSSRRLQDLVAIAGLKMGWRPIQIAELRSDEHGTLVAASQQIMDSKRFLPAYCDHKLKSLEVDLQSLNVSVNQNSHNGILSIDHGRTANRGRAALTSLPANILFKLAEELGIIDTLLLCLTCKRLWKWLHTDLPYLIYTVVHARQKTEFLLKLEKQLTNCFACVRCLKLHYRVPDEEALITREQWSMARECNQSLSFVGLIPFGPDEVLRFISSDAMNLAIRGVTSGPGHGLSLDAFRYVTHWTTWEYDIKVDFSNQAKVIPAPSGRPHLFIRSVYTFGIDTTMDVREQLDDVRFVPCHHPTGDYLDCWIMHLIRSEPSCGRCTSRHMCDFCPTDFMMGYFVTPGNNTVLVQLNVVRDLGSRLLRMVDIWNSAMLDEFYVTNGDDYMPEYDRTCPDRGYSFGLIRLHSIWDAAS